MGIAKTDRDVAAEDHAWKLNAALRDTRMNVLAGGDQGPYMLVVARLSKAELERVIEAVRRVLDRG